MGFKTFEDIKVWQEARLLSVEIRNVCKRITHNHDWSWIDQISRATLSIMANIAEGNDADTNPQFIQFLSYAKRSSAEVRSHLYYGFDAGYISKNELEKFLVITKKIGAQLATLMRYLNQHSQRDRSGLSSN
jgi:four helix bundle protein